MQTVRKLYKNIVIYHNIKLYEIKGVIYNIIYYILIFSEAPMYTRPSEGSCPQPSPGYDWLPYNGFCYMFKYA